MNILKTLSRGKKSRTIKWWVLWDEYFSMLQTKNNSKRGTSTNQNFYGDLVSLYSGVNKITALYVIESFSPQMTVSYKSTLRKQARGGTKISFIDLMTPHNIDFYSRQLDAKTKAIENQKRELEAVSLSNITDTATPTQRVESFEDSYFYFFNSQKSGHYTAVLRSCIVVSGDRGDFFDETLERLEKSCRTQGIQILRITGNIEEILKFTSPFSLADLPDMVKSNKTIPPTVLTDEILSRMVTFSHGTASYGSMLWGTDVYSNKPILKDPKRSSTSAENWAIISETGGGKSYFTKSLIMQLASNKNFIGTINDLEGDEYLPIIYLLAAENPDSVKVLNMGEGEGAYFDPVEVYLSGDDEQDREMLKFSQSFTTSLFKTIVSQKILDKYTWVELLLSSGMNKFYEDIGIDASNPETWVNTKGKTIFDVYRTIKEIPLPNEDAKKSYDMLMTILDTRFADNKGVVSLFDKRINFVDIIDTKLLLCSFGMAGRSASTVDPVVMALMQLYTANISHLRSIFAKAKGKYNFKVWEELPRWGDFPDSEKTLKTPLVGGRKLGDINIIITNQPTELVTTDRFGLFDSISSFALGSIGSSETRERLCKLLNIPEMLPELDLLEKQRVSEQKQGKADSEYADVMNNMYSKAFLIGLDKADYYIGKVKLPKSIATSSLFHTGVKEQSKKGGLKYATKDIKMGTR